MLLKGCNRRHVRLFINEKCLAAVQGNMLYLLRSQEDLHGCVTRFRCTKEGGMHEERRFHRHHGMGVFAALSAYRFLSARQGQLKKRAAV